MRRNPLARISRQMKLSISDVDSLAACFQGGLSANSICSPPLTLHTRFVASCFTFALRGVVDRDRRRCRRSTR